MQEVWQWRNRLLRTAGLVADLWQRVVKKVRGMIPLLLGAGVLTVVLALLAIVVTPFLPGEYQEILRHVQRGDWAESRAALTQAFDGLGAAKPYAFFAIQMFQVLFAPIPGQLMGLLGGYLFGFWFGLFLTMAGLMAGSAVAMLLGRWLGARLVRRVVPKGVLEKFDFLVSEGGLWNFFMLFLLPALPDDALCFVAGLTRWRIPHLVAVCLLGRLPGMAVLTFVGASVGGDVAGANVVLAVATVGAAALWLYSDEAEEFFYRLGRRMAR